jgi:hypothetical protein
VGRWAGAGTGRSKQQRADDRRSYSVVGPISAGGHHITCGKKNPNDRERSTNQQYVTHIVTRDPRARLVRRFHNVTILDMRHSESLRSAPPGKQRGATTTVPLFGAMP